MARMIPSSCDDSTASQAERRMFDLLRSDPATGGWVAIHSLGLARRGRKPYGEIDFVVLIPGMGVFCLEVKGGRVACNDGVWETTDRHDRTVRLRRSPFLQGREGMFALRDSILNRAPVGFPATLTFGYAVVMPDVVFDVVCPEWEPWQAIDRAALKGPISAALLRLASECRRLHMKQPAAEPTPETVRVIHRLLRPDFEVVVSRGTQLEETEARLLQLTEEQFDALDLLADNERCLFEGAAGTGKTMLAMEYARRSAAAGARTLLICYNRLLGDSLSATAQALSANMPLTAGRYFRLLRDLIMRSGAATQFQEREERDRQTGAYGGAYAAYGKRAIEEAGDRFDVLVMDEAQDLLRPEVLAVLNAWLRGGISGGRWAIFGDFHHQAIFGKYPPDELKGLLAAACPHYARGRLRMNCRNTRNIGEETALLSGFKSPPYIMGRVVGPPVDYHYYDSSESQRAALVRLLTRCLAEGLKPSDIVLLSRLKLPNSGIAGADGGSLFRIVEVGDPVRHASPVPTIGFATVQAFKGMESPVVVLCDVDQVTEGEPQSLLYVAMSRARSHLTVLVNGNVKPLIAEAVRRKLQEGWIRSHE